MPTPLLGWIEPANRTQDQHDAHARALAAAPKFSLAPVAVPVGTKIMLTDFWARPEVVGDVGFVFNGFWQRTGSCVGASDGNAVFTVGAIQRCIADAPTKAFVPFWPFNYGRCRLLEGDRGQGEGAVDSVMGTQNGTEGLISVDEAGLPAFQRTADGLTLTAALEMQWSDGAGPATRYLAAAKPHLMGTRAPLYSAADVQAAVVNGYPVLDGDNNYVGHGQLTGSGDTAYVRGRYDARGGHSTGFVGFWSHPNDGPLYAYSNQWPTNTYPKDPAGLGRCCVWIPESEVDKHFRSGGGGDGETMALSHLNWFPSQSDKLLDWFV